MLNLSHNVLIVNHNKDDQQSAARLLKRSIANLSNASLMITYASTIEEAKNLMADQEFTIIVLAGEFPGYVNARFGHDFVSYIREFYDPSVTVIMISDEPVCLKLGLKHGANIGVHKELVNGDLKFDEGFELVPIHS